MEKAVEGLFSDFGPVRRRSILLYAQRHHSRLRPTEIARRYGRRPSTVTMATRAIEEAARSRKDLADRLAALPKALEAAPDEPPRASWDPSRRTIGP